MTALGWVRTVWLPHLFEIWGGRPYSEGVTWSLRLTSYNTLADAYASKRLYAAVDSAWMDWDRRGPKVVNRVVGLEPEIACLQEVQASHWPAMQTLFAEKGWQGCYAQKGQSRPDGCAIVYRGDRVRLVDSETLYFDDGEAPSGHLALIAWFQTQAGLVRVATTHLRWQAAQAATEQPERHIGYREAVQLLERCAAPGRVLGEWEAGGRNAGGLDVNGLNANGLNARELDADHLAGTVICGDFNVSPGSSVVALFERAGFRDAYAVRPQATCNPNGRAARIDYIFTSGRLEARAEAIPMIAAETLLPSADEPSDHLPITAELRIQSQHQKSG